MFTVNIISIKVVIQMRHRHCPIDFLPNSPEVFVADRLLADSRNVSPNTIQSCTSDAVTPKIVKSLSNDNPLLLLQADRIAGVIPKPFPRLSNPCCDRQEQWLSCIIHEVSTGCLDMARQ